VSEDGEPDWPAELARQIEAVVRAAERFARAGAWPVVRAVNAAMGELLPARLDANVQPATLEASATFPAEISGSFNITLSPPSIILFGEAGGASDRLTVEVVPDALSGQAERSVGQILAMVLVAIVASGLLGVQGPDRAAVDHYLTVIGVALTISVLIWTKRS
jgi:hypothetical protein